jgi:hypothetical protein
LFPYGMGPDEFPSGFMVESTDIVLPWAVSGVT